MKILHTQPQDKTEIHFSNLNDIYDGSCDELELFCIDYIPKALDYLAVALKKLAIDGKISIIGTDLNQVSRKVFYGMANLKDVEQSMYSGRVMIYSLENILDVLNKNRINVEYKNIGEVSYNIIGRRSNG